MGTDKLPFQEITQETSLSSKPEASTLHLYNLQNEILLNILSHFTSFEDILTMSAVSKRFKALTENESLICEFIARDFGQKSLDEFNRLKALKEYDHLNAKKYYFYLSSRNKIQQDIKILLDFLDDSNLSLKKYDVKTQATIQELTIIESNFTLFLSFEIYQSDRFKKIADQYHAVIKAMVMSSDSEPSASKALLCAVQLNNIVLLNAFIDAGAALDVIDNGNAPITVAAYFRFPHIIEILLKAGANVNFQNTAGGTALSNAAWHGDLNTVKLLLQYGADLHLPDKKGNTPIMMAASNGHLHVVQYLIKEQGISLDSRGEDNETMAMLAARFSHLKLLKFLVNSGADTTLTDQRQRTALRIAESYHNTKGTNFLKRNNRPVAKIYPK